MSRLSIVVPARDAAETLEACLVALRRAAPGAELVVVDDGSVDDTLQIARRHADVALQNPTSLGTSGARNRGWRESSGELVAFVDSDVFVQPDALDRMVAALDGTPERLGINGILSLDVAATGLVSGYVNTSLHFQHLRHGRHVSSAFTGMCLLRRSALEQMGGWDDHNSVRYADDVSTRFLLPPGSIGLEPLAQGRHRKQVGLGGLCKHRFNVGYHYVGALKHNRGQLRLDNAVLDRRYPLNTVAGGLWLLGPLAWPLPLGLTLAANADLVRFTLRHRGRAEALAALPLSALEGIFCFLGASWRGSQIVTRRA